MWPFRKKPEPPHDCREWNEDWKIGDTAECIVDGTSLKWHSTVPPWDRPEFRQRLTVAGFSEGEGLSGAISYFLRFEEWPVALATPGFRKVRPIEASESEVITRILEAPKVGSDRVREGV